MTATAAVGWQNRIVGHAEVAPGDLVPNPRKWRTHPPEQQRALGSALSEIGWVTGVVVNRTTGNVVDGHLRIELALARHESTVPIMYVELTEAEEALSTASRALRGVPSTLVTRRSSGSSCSTRVTWQAWSRPCSASQ
jgi:hypothetical protein